jgi:glucose/arabinose dehydrogenase
MRKVFALSGVGAALAVIVASNVVRPAVAAPALRAVPCDADNANLTLPAGFCATLFASNMSAPRHMVVAPNGDLLVIGNSVRANAESGGGMQGSGLYLLRDANKDGKAEFVKKLATGSGSGIALANGYIYHSAGRTVVREKYSAGDTVVGPTEVVIDGLYTGGHTANNFAIVDGTLFLNIGSGTNSCQEKERTAGSKGIDPCVELETRAGIWSFDANKLGQKVTDGVRFATGIRNSVSLTVNPKDKTLWATMHGRDGLQAPPVGQWTFSNDYGAENPGEQVNHIVKGADFAWPYCYYSHEEKKYVTAPEYGGDGKQSSRCGGKSQPAYVFPGHWAPNDMMFYTGSVFPATYKNGAFIAFHGSWNRAPLPQQGFRVVFLPLNGEKGAPHQDFATDFSNNGGPGKDGKLHRPTGLAQGTDGSLYIADDVGGLIYKVSYKGK